MIYNKLSTFNLCTYSVGIMILLLQLTLLYSQTGYSQTNEIDSLRKLLQLERADSNRVIQIIRLGSLNVVFAKIDSGIVYLKEALQLAEKINFKKGIANSYYELSETYKLNDNYDSAHKYSLAALHEIKENDYSGRTFTSIRFLIYTQLGEIFHTKKIYDSAYLYYNLAIKIAEQKKEKKSQSIANLNLGNLLRWQENYSAALEHLFTALKLSEEMDDKDARNAALTNIGYLYYDEKDFQSALKYHSEALKLAQEMNFPGATAACFKNVGDVHIRLRNYDSAKINLDQAVALFEKFNAKSWLGVCYLSLGELYEAKGNATSLNNTSPKIQFNQALAYYFTAYDIHRSIHFNEDESLYSIGNVFFYLKKFDSANAYLLKSLALAKASSTKQLISKIYSTLSAVDSAQGRYADAYKNYKLHIAFRDSVYNVDNTRRLEQVRMQYELNKSEMLSKAALDKKDTEASRARLIALVILVSIVLISGFLFMWYKQQKKQESAKAIMNERLRISRELHDEVGATLSGVAMYSHLTRTQLQSKDIAGVENSLTVMQDSSAQMVNKLNDIVWLINADKGSLPDLIQRLEEYARQMAAAKNMELRVVISERIGEHQLTMEQRRNIYLFCKEAINNAVKYSEGTILELNVKQEGNLLEFSIRDNGIGFDPETVRRGNGLNNLQQRADEIGAAYTVEAKEGKGSIISLQVKITQ